MWVQDAIRIGQPFLCNSHLAREGGDVLNYFWCRRHKPILESRQSKI